MLNCSNKVLFFCTSTNNRFNFVSLYRVMGDYKIGKCGVRFKELAEELNRAVLTMKKNQETRWVRAELRSIQTLLRNLPTIGK